MANGIKLSILIPTIFGREEQFNKLYNRLQKQLQRDGIWNEVEVVSECDDRTMSIGNKRQLLVSRSYGEFVVFIDDDDQVPDNYCLKLWETISENPGIDCIGFLQDCYFDGKHLSASLSNRWKDWGKDIGGFNLVRTPFFPTPIRRDIVVEIGYRDMRYGEDHDFSKRLKESGLIRHECFIEEVLYIYQYTTRPFAEKYGQPKTT